MALTQELLKILDNEEEPLAKRLKIADNAFKSADLPIQHKEAVLLQWLRRVMKNSQEPWEVLLSWLRSHRLQKINRNDINQEDVKSLTKVISKRKRSEQLPVLECATALIENQNIQIFFKYDLNMYCTFVRNILEKINNNEEVKMFLTNEHLFPKNVISEEFQGVFIENILPELADIIKRNPGDSGIFLAASKLVQRCIFHRNIKAFNAFLNGCFEESWGEETIPLSLINYLNKCKDEFLFKLTFHSFCASYNNFSMIYKLYVIFLQVLDFDMASYFQVEKLQTINSGKLQSDSLNDSIEIVTKLNEVLIGTDKDLNIKLKDIIFSELIKSISLTILSSTNQPTIPIYNFLDSVIKLDPLLVEKIISDLLVFTMLSYKQNMVAPYEKFLISVFEVFAKLHRISNLISKIIVTVKSVLEGTFAPQPPPIQFISSSSLVKSDLARDFNNAFPQGVLAYFTQCITGLASWQVMNLFKTFLFHLEGAVADVSSADESKVAYIEFLSILTCQFLTSVRIAEHNVQPAVVEKFVRAMEDHKNILGKFGSSLVKMEHNPKLMKAYLSMCYTWGELYIMLAYYWNKEVAFQKSLDSDFSACNITYLHSYLTRDQWCLFSQRITNFGEKPCKLIMHKMYIQKVKAMLLFENCIQEEIIASVRTSLLGAIDDNWKDIIFNDLVLDAIVSKADSLRHVSDVILQDAIRNGFDHMQPLFECKELTCSMLYVVLHKINKLFKKKGDFASVKVFGCMTEEMFVREANVEGALTVFFKEVGVGRGKVDVCIKESDLDSYLDAIKAIPVLQYNRVDLQQMLTVYLVSLLVDLNSINVNDKSLVEKCEHIIVGTALNRWESIKYLNGSFNIIQILIDSCVNYSEMFKLIFETIMAEEKALRNFKDGVSFLISNAENDRYMSCLLIILRQINKVKKSTSSEEKKKLKREYEELICESLISAIKKKKLDVSSTEAFAWTVNYILNKTSEKKQKKRLSYINEFAEEILNNTQGYIKGSVMFFTRILAGKSKLPNFKTDTVLKIWNYCRQHSVKYLEDEDYPKLVMLIFENVPNEQFEQIANDLLVSTIQTLKENGEFTQFNVWNALISCSFNVKKMKIWKNTLESLLNAILLSFKDIPNKRQDTIQNSITLELSIIQNIHIQVSSPLIELSLLTVSFLLSSGGDFHASFLHCASLMEALLKFRSAILLDMLPAFLQRYRGLLTHLCAHSNAGLALEVREVQKLSDCAHKLERLTKILTMHQKDVARIAPYIIADVLKQYEEISLYPNVKIHLNNCLYNLVNVCDQHAIAFLMRVLSTASREMFKIVYENYRKYYKFTGRV